MFGMNLLAFCLLLCATSCSADDAATSKSRTLRPWLVGLSAVVGFLLIVFIILILNKLLNKKRTMKEEWGYESTEMLHPDDKETKM